MPVTRKTEIKPINGTPVKRMFWSIVNDYDLKTSICELIDNALDPWIMGGRKRKLTIDVDTDVSSQLIRVTDNSGGVPQHELELLIAPGGSRNEPHDEIIGVFGVGGKRASIALGKRVEIKTRHEKGESFQLDITEDWLRTNDWEIPAYAIPDISPRTTTVEISNLRKPLTKAHVEEIRLHLGDVYAWFINNGCTLSLDGDPVAPISFEHWAYPEAFHPKATSFDAAVEGESVHGESVHVEITAGLITDRVPELDNYGVYVYCNHRLIAKELRTRDVGYYVTSEAGVPHTDASLCRAIVRLQGPAQLMPWNSSKNGINTDHSVFTQLRPSLIKLVAYFSSLSRRTRNEWETEIFPYTTGTVEQVAPEAIGQGSRLRLPNLPRVNKSQAEHLKARNKKTIRDAPWVLGLIEAIAAVDVITRQRLDTRNRIALILLDSNFEIALKEFIVHRTDLFPPQTYNKTKIGQLFRHRPDVITEVTDQISIPAPLLKRAEHYYDIRNKLIHERATVDVSNADIDNYRSTVEEVLRILFGLRF